MYRSIEIGESYDLYIFILNITYNRPVFKNFIVSQYSVCWGYNSIIDNFFNLTYVQNRGVAFGLFQGKIDIVSILALIAIGLILFYFCNEILKR